jgi:tetratricopeptide (TPR) repeat protein
MSIYRVFFGAAIFFGAAALVLAQGDREVTANVASAVAGEDFDKALQLLQPALKQFPENAKLWTLEGLALAGKGQTKEALAAYEKALKISSEFVPALEGAAQIEYKAGDQKAVPLLKRLVSLRPSDPTSHAMLAVLAEKRGDCTQAVEEYGLSGTLLDSQPALRTGYAACLLELKRTDEAIAVLQKPVEANDADPVARYRLAEAQLVAERPDAALETLAPLLQTEKPEVRALELAASAHEAKHDTAAAVSTLRQAILLDPHNVDLYIDFALLSIDHRSYQVGIDMVNVGLQAEPKAAPLYVARGVLYAQLAKYDEAEADFEKSEELEPGQQFGSLAQGLEEAQANDPERALKTVRAKLASKPDDPYLLYLEANLISQGGPQPRSTDFQTALHSAKRAVALQPTLVAARDVLAKLYLQAGQTQAAIEQCREALKYDPKDQTALYHLIQALRKTGNKEELPDLLKRLAELRAESTKEEMEHNRYKLVEAGGTETVPARP